MNVAAAGTGTLLALWRDAQARGWRAADIDDGWRFSAEDGSVMSFRFGDGFVGDLLSAVAAGRTLTVTGAIGQAQAVRLLREFLGWAPTASRPERPADRAQRPAEPRSPGSGG